MAKKQQHDEAQRLYLEGKLSQKEISETLGVSERTLSKWVTTEGWEEMKFAVLESKTESLKMLHQQLHNLLVAINGREDGARFPSKSEADVISQLRDSIEKLERKTSITDIVNVGIELCDFVKSYSIEKAREISNFFNKFISHKINDAE